MNQDSGARRRRGIYLLPNLITTAALFAGFYAIAGAMNGRFHGAAIAIFVAMLLDAADGRIARITSTESAFGAEYDSLSDLVSFGLAPALVAYGWSLLVLGKLGWLAAFVYTAATALRLARFNTQVGKADKRYFQGLPCPAAAAVVGGWVWVGTVYALDGPGMALVSFAICLLSAILMVSNIRYRSFKEVDIRDRVPFVTLIVVMLGFSFVAINPPLVVFAVFSAYALSGPLVTLVQIRARRAERRRALRAPPRRGQAPEEES